MDFPDKNIDLYSDCENCFGLCCVALYFSSSEGFPTDKEAGKPCINLQPDFRCSVHKSLKELGLKGCISFECFGAGQKVSQVSFYKQNWIESPKTADKMFKVFLTMRQLHELLWYLTEALTLEQTASIHPEIRKLLEETQKLTYLDSDTILELNLSDHRAKVNVLLMKISELVRKEYVSKDKKNNLAGKKTFGRGVDYIGADLKKIDLKGANLRGAYLIASDLRGNDLSGTDLIGADFRDADIRGADLSKSLFLTQAQISSAKGDSLTKLPATIKRPEHWKI